MSLWDWATAAYARPGAEALCLTLQDQHGQCVPLLLWAAWTAREGRALEAALLADAVNLARDWESEVVRPLRRARRSLARRQPQIDERGQAGLRKEVKAQELAAERLLMDALERISPDASGPPRDPRADLDALVLAWAPAPAALVEALSRAFSAS